ncbi:hypothetical protein VOLCADRAFT_109400 [Volvox carteri f. nagariensis]|uniref:RNA polymerase sigma-70 domain-containing protein n=1 Tax=Volvox carteri f. nagariensis TaxID=3068 RepID=D8UF26_VOLCA|nr:uncharacterized protein VOLCADRAFT_109400 [Volvox carteri f. nagariensis]EFJ41698.1 hypothetical protein VOLCADRAFT_109400 [Volvox carteri f. nagariensis]|eukprot:XP_002957200.1 hypothetical protein VOLCADRAFT_109400 [Volvox carteri f. nagariensis]
MAFTNVHLQHASISHASSSRITIVTRAVAAPTRPVKSAVPELLDGRLAEQASVNFQEYTQATQMLNRLKGQASDLELLLDQLNALEASLDDNLLAPPALEEPDDRAARQAKRAARRAERRARATTAEVMQAAVPSTDAFRAVAKQSDSHTHSAPSSSATSKKNGTRVALGASAANNCTVSDVQHLEELFKLTFGEPELPLAAPAAPQKAASEAAVSPPASGPLLRPRKVAKKSAAAAGQPEAPAAQAAPPPRSETTSISQTLERLFQHDFSYDDGDFLGMADKEEHVMPSDEDLRALEGHIEDLSISLDDNVQHGHGEVSGSRELERAALAPRAAEQVSILSAGPSLLNLVHSSAAPGRTARGRQARRSARLQPGRSGRSAAGAAASAAANVRGKAAGNDGTDHFLHSSANVNILSPEAELEVTEMCQDFLFLEKVKRQCEKTLHRKPTNDECAAAVGMDVMAYNMRYDAGLKAKELLLKSNYRLVMTVCKRYIGKGMHLQDLVSEGVKGLLRGVEMYDASRGFRFGTYAHWWIRQAVSRSMAETGRAVRLPVHMIEQLTKLKNATAALAMELNREPSVEEMAEAVGLPPSRVELLLDAARAASSMESAIGGDDGLTIKDAVQDERMAADEAFGSDSMRADVESMLEGLSDREACVLRLRFGLEDGVEWTLEDIGSRLGVTRERIRQLEAKALRKLQVKTIDVTGKLKDYSENLSLMESKDTATRTSSGTRKT